MNVNYIDRLEGDRLIKTWDKSINVAPRNVNIYFTENINAPSGAYGICIEDIIFVFSCVKEKLVRVRGYYEIEN